MRNTKAFKEAVAETLAELARRGVTFAPTTVADTIEQQITTVSERLWIQARSAWRYFDASATADHLAKSQASYEESSSEKGVGQAPVPPIDNPELALVLAGVPDSLAQPGGDLYAVILNVAVNAWVAGHIHGEDGCTGCDGSRGRPDTTGKPGCAPSPRCSRTSPSGSTATCGPPPSTTAASLRSLGLVSVVVRVSRAGVGLWFFSAGQWDVGGGVVTV
ncbi:hypothetical protein ACFVT1_39600 [Streptomyces sp. NPDC057963]|uniref:hypothetical protein n=1 Tax=Streptomyces sp. NPDC057963 TaxID=3346290 RepID=UPI0036E556E3